VIVIGLGTGRSGTTSLAKLFNSQRDTFCFHEMNVSSVRFVGTPRPVLNSVDEFQAIIDGGDPSMVTVDLGRPSVAAAYDRLCKLPRVGTIGDVGMYYLSYVEAIAARNPNVRFLCTRRDIDETVKSWLKQTEIRRWRSKYWADRVSSWIVRAPFYESYNYWMAHDGTRWEQDARWDKLFPKFDASSKEEAIRKYCEYYYKEADRLARSLPGVFRFVETKKISDREHQAGFLNFVGIRVEDQIFSASHINQSKW
jgi:Sulfotransferase family